MTESSFFENEARSLFLGDFLGRGSTREVYAIHSDDSSVIKIETGSRAFQNVEEWSCWTWLKHLPISDWFAPCISISAAGSMLIQRRVYPMRPGERPVKVPAFLCDLKPENFGMLDGRPVCCDYGTVLSAIRQSHKHLVKADWRE